MAGSRFILNRFTLVHKTGSQNEPPKTIDLYRFFNFGSFYGSF
ncbi:hypothetical protein [Alteromonas phage XX1924]|nr:hypothetical protein [Alteromonas phage XX1924]